MFSQNPNTVYPSNQTSDYKDYNVNVIGVTNYGVNRLEPLPAIPSAPPPPYYEHPPYTNVPPTQEPEGFTTGSLSSSGKEIRRTFVKKVYAILFVQLLTTAFILCFFTLIDDIRNFFQERIYIVFIIGILVVILFLSIGYNKKVKRNYPSNIISLGILTLALSFFAGAVASTVRTEAVLIAFGITAGVFLLVTLLTITTKLNFTNLLALGLVILIVLLFFVILTVATYSYIWYIQVVYGFIIALVMSVFLSYDTRRLVTKKGDSYNPEDYVDACLEIYTDIVVLFVVLLICIAAGGGGAGQ